MKTPKRVGLIVLLKILTGSAELVRVRQALSRVGDSFDILNGLLLDVENFLYVVYAFPSIGDINEVRFLLFVNKINHPMSPATNYKRRFAETQRANCQAAVWKRVDIRSTISRNTWMVNREQYVVCKLDGLAACTLVIGVKHTTPHNLVLVCHKGYHAQMTADALIFAKTRIKEILY